VFLLLRSCKQVFSHYDIMLLKLTVRIMLGGISMQQMSECGWRSFVPMYVTLHYFSFPLENVQYIFHGFLGPQNLNPYLLSMLKLYC
jgi:hypothetical protein